MTGDPIDVDALMREIDDDVRRRRADGELDPGWERELDDLFGAVAPAGVVGDFPRLLDDAQRATAIDATPPSASDRAGGEAIKRALGRGMQWYVAGVAQQVGTLGTALVEAVRVLGTRVDRLEQALGGVTASSGPRPLPPHVDLEVVAPTVVELLRPTNGRVVHADAGDGAVVRALTAAAVDAYGVEPRTALAERAGARGVEVRETDALGHLGALPPAALGAVVLSGGVDTAPNDVRTGLLHAVRRAVVPDGACVIVAWEPAGWGVDTTRVVADLAPGRPWHAETWTRVLDDCGFTTRSVTPGPQPGTQVLAAVRRA
jgi:hypothetical protein